MEVLAIIPARGGSKSIPRKNIYPVLGKPLIAYSIEAARKARLINRVIVSTDDLGIARIAKKYGAEIPFMRPPALGRDTTPDLPVFKHALSWLKKHEGYTPDLVVHLWPTSPFRNPKDIDRAITLAMKNPEADCIRSVTLPLQTPFKMWRKGKTYLEPILKKDFTEFYKKHPEPYTLPRQVLPKTLVQTGYLSVIRCNTLMKKNSMMGRNILPFFHDPKLYTEFDSLKDVHHTEYVLKKQKGLTK